MKSRFSVDANNGDGTVSSWEMEKPAPNALKYQNVRIDFVKRRRQSNTTLLSAGRILLLLNAQPDCCNRRRSHKHRTLDCKSADEGRDIHVQRKVRRDNDGQVAKIPQEQEATVTTESHNNSDKARNKENS